MSYEPEQGFRNRNTCPLVCLRCLLQGTVLTAENKAEGASDQQVSKAWSAWRAAHSLVQ